MKSVNVSLYCSKCIGITRHRTKTLFNVEYQGDKLTLYKNRCSVCKTEQYVLQPVRN